MAAAGNIPRDIQESIRDVLDKRVKVSVKRLVKMEIRTDKMDNRVLAFSPCRLFILTAKVPSKLENSFHFLDIQSIESKKPNQLTLMLEGKPYTFCSVEVNSDDVDHMITHIGISLKQIFPSFPLERLIVKIDVQPVDRLKTMNEMIKNLEQRDVGPCGAFTTMYQCMCDYHGLPFREEVAWDVDTIYLSHDSRELRLQDFDHLSGKDLVPIIGALEHNTWFKRINASNVKLTMETCNELIKVMKRNAVIEEVNLSNTGIKIDFVQKFALAIISNSGTQLTSLDLSNNLLEDRAITHLLGAVKMLPCGLSSFDISRTGVSTRCLNKVGEALAQSPNVLAVLTTLKLNDNGFKGDDFPMLYNCLAQPNMISYLDLSFTDCALDALCDPLRRGCPNLVTFKASRTVFTHKRGKDVIVPLSWKQLFASSCCLEHIDFSSCKLPPEALKEMLLGLSSNRSVKNVYVDLSSNDLGTAGANVLSSCIASISCIKGLELSNNGFDIDLKGLLPEISKNSYLRQLSIGRNFNNIKPKYMSDVMNAVAFLLQEESCALESLSVADSKLKGDTTYVINSLGSNDSLQEIDISGNSIGDIGARMLAKALLINTKLRKVVWDKNNVSAQGFEDVAEALQKNLTLRKMPYPINDAVVALRMYPERTEAALQRIESFLQRNHNPRRYASDQAYRLQQGFLISSTQQMVDRLVVQVQDTVNALQSLGTMEVYAADVDTAEKMVAGANKSRQLFSGLQDIAIKSQTSGNPIEVHLQTVADSLRQAIEEQLKKTEEEMLKCTSDHCPAIMANRTFQSSVKEGCQEKSTLPKDFMQRVLEGPTADVFNTTGEMNLAMAALISDSVIEEVIDSLSNSHKALTNHLNLRKSGHYKEQVQKEEIKLTGEPFLMPPLEFSIYDSSPKFADKRKSLLNRKMRPQSTMDSERRDSYVVEDETDPEEAVYQNLRISTGEEALAMGSEGQGKKAGLQQLEERSTESTPLGSTEKLADFGDLPSASSRPLEHITKARPRREKAHRPTRPIVATGTTEMEEGTNNGIKPSYQSQTSAAATSRETGKAGESSVSQSRQEPSKAKHEEPASKSEGKKWMPGFMKKNKEDKDSKDAKKSNSFGSSFSSIFKKEKKRPSQPEVEVEPPAVKPAVDKVEPKPVEHLDVVKEAEAVSEEAGDSLVSDKSTTEATVDLDKVEEKVVYTPKSPKERLPFDRPALIPPSKKPETRAPTLALEEDTSLSVDEAKAAAETEETPPSLPNAPPPVEPEEKKDEGPKMPAVLAKMPGLGALGGKNLLHEMKLKQEKRFSKLPSPGEEEKDFVKEKPSKEANNNLAGGKADGKAVESHVKKNPIAGKDVEPFPKKSPIAGKDPEPFPKKSPILLAGKDNEPFPKKSPGTGKVAEPFPKKSPILLAGKDNEPIPKKSPGAGKDTEPFPKKSPILLAGKDNEPIPKKSPGAGKDTEPFSKKSPIMGKEGEPPLKKSPATSKPEAEKVPTPEEGPTKRDLNDNNSEASPSRPALKPTPPAPSTKTPSPSPRVMVPPKRPVSTVEDSNVAQELPKSMTTSTPELVLGDSSSGPAVNRKSRPPPPIKPRPQVMPRPKKTETTPDDNAESAPATAQNTTPVTTSGSQPPETSDASVPSAKAVDEGIVYDSATLRMSVKDKIKRLSQAKAVNDSPSPVSQATQHKTMSLPKDSKFIENESEETTRESRRESSSRDSKLSEGLRSSIAEEESAVPKPESDATPQTVPDDEIMV